ncbi:MAG: hypothetical protein WC738_06850 [Candidatus Omnitrophota bacterium]|jgi:hypothetical protein
MKKKFESNVASEIPKTKLHEPELPWKLTDSDLAEASGKNEEYKAVINGTPPLKTRPIFLVMFVAAIFVVIALTMTNIATENRKIQDSITSREKELVSIKANLDKIGMEKDALSKSSAQLEKKVSDLAAQKELFTTVIESLTKKSDEAEVDKNQAPQVPQAPQSAN